jgi:hypothetical protein
MRILLADGVAGASLGAHAAGSFGIMQAVCMMVFIGTGRGGNYDSGNHHPLISLIVNFSYWNNPRQNRKILVDFKATTGQKL